MPLVTGIDTFREALKGFEDCYVLIGGGACSILFDEVGSNFRATSDLDIVILTEAISGKFGDAFWSFIQSGQYESWKNSIGEATYYRFILPNGSPYSDEYPKQIELFARHPDYILFNEESEIAPLHIDEDIRSLSAIVLNDGYYDFIRDSVSVIDGVPLLEALHVIPLKMRAHIDLNRKHDAGEHVNDKDLRKHRADICSLVGLLPGDASLHLDGTLREDAQAFLEDFDDYINRETSAKKRRALAEVRATLQSVYL